MKSFTQKYLIPLITVVFSAITFFLSNGVLFIWQLAWISPIPLLVLMHKSEKMRLFKILFFTYFLGSTVYYFTLRNTVPLVFIILTVFLFAVIFSFIFLVSKIVARKLNPIKGVFVFPLVWTITEFILYSISDNGHWGSLANTQTQFISLIQIASITGSLGITFILSLFSSLLAYIWIYRRNKLEVLKLSILPMILILGTFTFGLIKINTKNNGEIVNVGVYSTNKNIKYFKTEKEHEAIKIVEGYINIIEFLSKKGAQVILFPEKMVGVTDYYVDKVLEILSNSAAENKVKIIIGINHKGQNLSSNDGWVIAEDGKLILNHTKNHLVPGWETGKYIGGNEIGVFNNNKSKWGVVICKDNDFPYFTRKYGKEDVKIVYAPTWDFIYDAKYHMRLAVLRSVENGYSLVRSNKQGISSVNNDLGQIKATRENYNDNEEVMFIAEIQEGKGQTLYSKYGDWFSYLCIILLLVLISIRYSKNSQNSYTN